MTKLPRNGTEPAPLLSRKAQETGIRKSLTFYQMRNQADSTRAQHFDLVLAAQTDVVAIAEDQVHLAMQFVSSCKACCPAANLTFDYVLDGITERDPAITEYILPELPLCPSCSAPIDVKTLVTIG